MSKHDVIHKTGSTQRITTLPEEDRATAISNMHENLVNIGGVVPKIWSRRDKRTHKQTDRHGHHNTALPYRGRSNELRERAHALGRRGWATETMQAPVLISRLPASTIYTSARVGGGARKRNSACPLSHAGDAAIQHSANRTSFNYRGRCVRRIVSQSFSVTPWRLLGPFWRYHEFNDVGLNPRLHNSDSKVCLAKALTV